MNQAEDIIGYRFLQLRFTIQVQHKIKKVTHQATSDIMKVRYIHEGGTVNHYTHFTTEELGQK